MTTEINDGGPAFPQISELGDIAATSGGMSLRDWFAGQAMSGCYAGRSGDRLLSDGDSLRIDAEVFYQIADAMIAVRSKGGAK